MMYFVCIFYGGLFGAIGLSVISSELQPYPDDMYTYFLYSVPMGTLLGWISGGLIALFIDEKFIIAALVGLSTSSVLGAIHIQALRHEEHIVQSRVPISYDTVGLFWCFLIFLLGIYSLWKAKPKR